MDTFPANSETQVTLANWRRAPFSRWAFHHVREIIPTADIASAGRAALPLAAAVTDLGAMKIAHAGQTLDYKAWLAATDTDGLVVLHRGRMVAEHYANGMSATSPHILMSVSKSMLGLLAGVLIADGVLAEDRRVLDILPDLRGTAYRDATVRHLLDMRVGVAFVEDYLATEGPIVAYRRAQGWNPPDPGAPPADLRSFFGALVERDGPDGGRFHYVSPNTDLLGWVIERATGRRYADVMSDRLWAPLGSETNAYITVDRLGAPRAAGGMCVTARDLARTGQLVLDKGRGIVPEAWIADIFESGDAAAWAAGSFTGYYAGRDMHYRSKWYAERGRAPLAFAMGVNGQNLFVDPRREVVIAKLSSQAQPLDADMIAWTHAGVAAIADALG